MSEHGERRQERDQRQAEHGVPAPGHGEPRAEERGQGRAAVAGPGDPHHQPLEAGRVPAARQRQRRGEARPRHAQQQADQQHLGEAIRPEPAEQQGQRRQRHPQDGGPTGADPVGQGPQHQPQHGPAEQRHRHHQALLRVRQAEVRRDRVRQRAGDQPDHAAHVEIQEGAEQRRRMAGAAEFAQVHRIGAPGVRESGVEDRSDAEPRRRASGGAGAALHLLRGRQLDVDVVPLDPDREDLDPVATRR